MINRRAGGLEVNGIGLPPFTSINRRAGGLEVLTRQQVRPRPINRRAGGLEEEQLRRRKQGFH